jgi:hypothetical protein
MKKKPSHRPKRDQARELSSLLQVDHQAYERRNVNTVFDDKQTRQDYGVIWADDMLDN